MAMAKNASRMGPQSPQAVVLFGATGDLSKRQLLPGLYHLCTAGFIPAWRIIGVSLDELDAAGFREMARQALEKAGERKFREEHWSTFAETLDYVSMSAGAAPLKAAVERAEQALG